SFLQDHVEGQRAFIDRRLHPGHQYLFLDNLPSMYGISTVSGYESEVPRSFYPTIESVAPGSLHPHALGLLGVKYYMFVNEVVPCGLLPLADSGSVMIYFNPCTRPRATIYYLSEILPND